MNVSRSLLADFCFMTLILVRKSVTKHFVPRSKYQPWVRMTNSFYPNFSPMHWSFQPFISCMAKQRVILSKKFGNFDVLWLPCSSFWHCLSLVLLLNTLSSKSFCAMLWKRVQRIPNSTKMILGTFKLFRYLWTTGGILWPACKHFGQPANFEPAQTCLTFINIETGH